MVKCDIIFTVCCQLHSIACHMQCTHSTFFILGITTLVFVMKDLISISLFISCIFKKMLIWDFLSPKLHAGKYFENYKILPSKKCVIVCIIWDFLKIYNERHCSVKKLWQADIYFVKGMWIEGSKIMSVSELIFIYSSSYAKHLKTAGCSKITAKDTI